MEIVSSLSLAVVARLVSAYKGCSVQSCQHSGASGRDSLAKSQKSLLFGAVAGLQMTSALLKGLHHEISY